MFPPFMEGVGQSIMLDWNWFAILTILEEHKVVFEEGLNKMKGFEAKILVKLEATSKF